MSASSSPPAPAPASEALDGSAAPATTRRQARENARRAAVRRPGRHTPSAPRASLADRSRRLREGTASAVGATAPVWRPVVTVLRWVSPLGWTVLVLGVVAWWVGVRFGWQELLMLAGAALVLFVACVLLALGRTRVSIVAEINPIRVTVGDDASGRVVVTNLTRTPLLPLLVELPVGATAARFVLPLLAAGSVHEELFVVPTNRRGVIAVGPATSVQGDPLGLVRRTVRFTDVEELFVHPRTTALESLGAGLLRDLEGAVTEDQSLSDLAFHALREYAPGDDRRYIHWRSSAKAGRLLVRQFLDTRRSHVTVLVDTDLDSYDDAATSSRRPVGSRPGPGSTPDDTASRIAGLDRTTPMETSDDLETAISVGASLALRVLRDEQQTTIVCGDRSVTATTSPQVYLDELARSRPATTDLVTQAVAAAALAPDTSILFLVTGPERPFIDLRRAVGQFPPEVRPVVVVVDPGSTGGIRAADGLRILTLRSLDDLRSLVYAGMAA